MRLQLLGDDLWSTITSLAKKSSRAYVAVAYLSGGAGRLLPLHAGDRLIIDLSKGAVRGGQTNPFEVEKYLKKGVKVYNYGNLHAKVYIFDNSVIVCSANVSHSSKDNLIEVGLLSQDRHVLAQARGFVRSLQNEPVTPGYVKVCKKLYRPPEGRPGSKRNGGKGKIPRYTPVWILGVGPFTPSKEEEKLYDAEEKKALKKIRDSRAFETAFIKWPGESRVSRSIEEGHLVVQVDHRGKDVRVLPPFRVIRLTEYKDNMKKPWLVIWLEESKRIRSKSWKSFRADMVRAGINRLGKDPRRLVKNPDVADVILGLWS